MMKKLLLGLISFFGFLLQAEAQNLILNPSNEEELVNGEIPNWQEVQGTQWTQRCASPAAYEGSCYFYAGAVALGKLQQTIDLSDYATNIDNGIQEFYFSGYVVSYQQSPADQSQIELRYFSETNELLEEELFGPYNNTNDWMLVESNMIAPAGARSFTVTLVSIRANGTNNDGYFDALNFVAIEPPIECTLDVTITQDGDYVAIEAHGNGANSGTYAINWGDGSEIENSSSSMHFYTPGEYILCVNYFDSDTTDLLGVGGCFVEECFDVAVEEPVVCTVQLALNQSGNDVTATAIGEGLVEGFYSINWGDDSENTPSSSGTHSYTEDGVYEICVTYQDDLINPTCSTTLCGFVSITIIGIDEMNKNIGDFVVMPNPVSGDSQIVFSLNQSTNLVIDLVDVLGQNVQHITSSSFGQGMQRVKWDAQSLASGVYFVRVIGGSEQLNFRIIK